MYRELNLGEAVIYARISVIHNNNKDKTIENQIAVCKQFIEDKGFVVKGIYCDKGYSGMNFNRPDWIKLIKDCSDKKFNCIVVKDLSRIGRNYIETGMYIEEYFMKKRVRVIAVSDMYDSFNCCGDFLSFGIKNIINEWYVRELGQKISAVKQYKKENGEFIGSIAPYGYRIKMYNGKRVLAKADSMYILEMIKYMRKGGKTSLEISKFLSCSYVNTPSEYNRTGKLYCDDKSVYKKWDSASVRRLWNKTYTSGDNHTA